MRGLRPPLVRSVTSEHIRRVHPDEAASRTHCENERDWQLFLFVDLDACRVWGVYLASGAFSAGRAACVRLLLLQRLEEFVAVLECPAHQLSLSSVELRSGASQVGGWPSSCSISALNERTAALRRLSHFLSAGPSLPSARS